MMTIYLIQQTKKGDKDILTYHAEQVPLEGDLVIIAPKEGNDYKHHKDYRKNQWKINAVSWLVDPQSGQLISAILMVLSQDQWMEKQVQTVLNELEAQANKQNPKYCIHGNGTAFLFQAEPIQL